MKQTILMKTKNNKTRVAQFLCQPQGGRVYLLNALDSKSEQTFLTALHHIIDSMNRELPTFSNSTKRL